MHKGKAMSCLPTTYSPSIFVLLVSVGMTSTRHNHSYSEDTQLIGTVTQNFLSHAYSMPVDMSTIPKTNKYSRQWPTVRIHNSMRQINTATQSFLSHAYSLPADMWQHPRQTSTHDNGLLFVASGEHRSHIYCLVCSFCSSTAFDAHHYRFSF